MTISDHDDTNFGLKKWFFLADYPQILDKSVLYGTLVTCIYMYIRAIGHIIE